MAADSENHSDLKTPGQEQGRRNRQIYRDLQEGCENWQSLRKGWKVSSPGLGS